MRLWFKARPKLSLTLLASCLFLVGLAHPLLEPEEARYAEIPRQMLAGGHFLTPVLHGQPYLHKPPLLYWLVMACYELFGVHDWTARIVPALAGIGLILLTFHWARASVSRDAALVAAVVLCLSPRFVYQARMVSLDGLLAFFVVAGWTCCELALRQPKFTWKHWLIASLCCGLGFLTKGPVALALILMPLVLLRFRRPVPLVAWPLLVVAPLALAAPWFGYLFAAHADAAREFLMLHNIGRFVDPVDHEEPWWFFLPYLLLGTLPWSLWLPKCFRRAGCVSSRSTSMFPLCCLLCTVVFFSLSGCKRPGYILPAFPPLAVVLAGVVHSPVLAQTDTRAWLRFPGLAAVTFTLLLLAFCFALPAYHEKFGLRSQIMAQEDRLARDQLSVACFPKMWDSVPFYFARNNVEAFDASQRPDLIRFLERGPCLLFVKRRGFADEVLSTLPEALRLTRLGSDHANVLVALVVPRESPP